MDIADGKSSKKWNIFVITGTLAILFVFAGITIYVDPFFHYHEPIDHLEYVLKEERYQNDGIVRHFDYNAIITGTSMTENFKTSECDEFFGVKSIKVSFSGGAYKEINDNLKRALEANDEITVIIRCLDYSFLVEDKDTVWDGMVKQGYDYPEYLINDNPFDDVEYLFNKEVFFEWTYGTLDYTKSGQETTTFDQYASWRDRSDFKYGKDVLINPEQKGVERAETQPELSREEQQMIHDNIKQNVTDLAEQYPEVEFYLYFSPYSIVYWDGLDQSGMVNWHIDAEQYAIEQMLQYDNIKLFSFSDNFSMICNLDNYKDKQHYGDWVNTDILWKMSNDEGLLTKENYMDYINRIREFYTTYDYESLY